MRAIGLDIHRDFCEVAIAEGGRVRGAGRVGTAPAEIEAFARGLGSDDTVTLEATGKRARDRADPGAACPGRAGQPQGDQGGDEAPGQDRPDRRPDAGPAARLGLPARGLDRR